jgi:hypothetical protein
MCNCDGLVAGRHVMATTAHRLHIILLPNALSDAILDGLKGFGLAAIASMAGVVVPLTLAALGLAGAIYINLPVKTVSQAMVTTSFVTLSVLTLPHMIVPYLVKRFVTATAKGPYRDNALRGA